MSRRGRSMTVEEPLFTNDSSTGATGTPAFAGDTNGISMTACVLFDTTAE